MLRVVDPEPLQAGDVIVPFLNANDGLEAPDATRWRELGGNDWLRSGASRSVSWDNDSHDERLRRGRRVDRRAGPSAPEFRVRA